MPRLARCVATRNPSTALRASSGAHGTRLSRAIPLYLAQAVLLPTTKWRIREMSAKRSNKWIIAPATWNMVKPPIQANSRTTNRTVQILIWSSPSFFFYSSQMRRRRYFDIPDERLLVRHAGLGRKLCNFSDGCDCFFAPSFSGRRNILCARAFKYFFCLLDLL